MSNDLSHALEAGKKNRGVLSKLIIWESGVSKSQFYRIISGSEDPSPETKQRISKSLGISCDLFDQLHSNSRHKLANPHVRSGTKHSLTPITILAVSICMVGILGMMTFKPQQSQSPSLNEIIASADDGTQFIEDVTIPDGTIIPVNTKFEKVWRVKNTGTLVWKDRYLMRTTPASNLICSSPAMVPIQETLPGQTVDISVTFTTPHLPGSCRTDWKSSDERGNLHFPEMHGLFSIVTVVVE